MPTISNVYTEEPAYPVLAHTLLTPKTKAQDPSHPDFGPSNQNDWNLKEDWDAGIHSSGTGIFRCGTVIGFSRLRNRSKENDEYVGQVGGLITRHHLIHTDHTRFLVTFSQLIS